MKKSEISVGMRLKHKTFGWVVEVVSVAKQWVESRTSLGFSRIQHIDHVAQCYAHEPIHSLPEVTRSARRQEVES